MISPDKLSDLISEKILNLDLPKEPRGLYEPIMYTLQSGGKRLRPILVLATCQALGGEIQKAIYPAIGLETFHNFTLLHDDVMDNAEVRRGHPTVHFKWNSNTAILSGDAMLTLATQLVCRDTDASILPALLDVFNKSAMEVYEGQQYDMDYENLDDVSVDQYINMIRLKTSVLPGCACKMGALIAGADEQTQNAFYDYGVNLGLAFQLQDDWLDSFGDPLIFGKEIGGDILNGKKTWLLINALKEDRTGELVKIIADKNMNPQTKIRKVTEIFCYHDLSIRCRDLIKKYSLKAIECLDNIKIIDADRKYFADLAMRLVNRRY